MSSNPQMGPGIYDPREAQEKPRSHTAVFHGRRPDNVFGKVPDQPGPTDYVIHKDHSGFPQKNWNSQVQAFGNTEKKFAFAKEVPTIKSNVPGPGLYQSGSSKWASASSGTIVSKSKRTRFRKSMTHASFKSVTERTVDATVTNATKATGPVLGQYDERRNIAS